MTIIATNKKGPFGAPVYKYRALESLTEFKSIAQDADLICAIDLSRAGNHEIVFGRDRLCMILTSGTPENLNVVAFAIDFRTDQVEHLLAAVGVVKGHYEWNGEAHTPATV
jgi:hypothetical protein